ncbi:MAG: preprotein translocase subunit SecG [Planctomycetes bacterium]|nr:preprotein translocase subunit SecG [Planctomycetota bacterium]
MTFLAYTLLTLQMFVGIFLIVLILLQRGRGGGLAGAFGGMGGQSAFGTKAGDIFTRVTIVVAVIWFLLSCVSILAVNAASQTKRYTGPDKDAVNKAPAEDDPTGASMSGPGDGNAAGIDDKSVEEKSTEDKPAEGSKEPELKGSSDADAKKDDSLPPEKSDTEKKDLEKKEGETKESDVNKPESKDGASDDSQPKQPDGEQKKPTSEEKVESDKKPDEPKN